MSREAWPSPDAAPPSLPRLEDLPISERGYDQEAVRLAFDSFYRHAAQLDATLRALEAVEAFRRDADALRGDLRALRELGIGGSSEPAWTLPAAERPRPELPAVVLRLAAEAALIIAVAVVAGVAHFRTWVIVALMAAAFVVVAISEWLASRARFVPPAVAFLQAAPGDGEPAPYVEAPAPAWGAPALEPAEDTEPDALTVVEAQPAADEDEDDEHEPEAVAEDPWEAGVEADDDESESEPEPVERGGFFRRRR